MWGVGGGEGGTEWAGGEGGLGAGTGEARGAGAVTGEAWIILRSSWVSYKVLITELLWWKIWTLLCSEEGE